MKTGWEVKKLGDVCEIKPPKKEAKDKLKDTDLVTFLPMEDLGVLNKEVIGVKERQLKDVTGSYTYFADNDVLLAKITPCFENGKIGIARNLINGIGFGSSEYIVFRSKGEIIQDYLYYFLSRETFRDEGKKLMTGAVGHKRVSKDFIENYPLPFPKSLPEQQRIVAILDEAFAAIAQAKANAEQNLKNAKELFESYLQSVFENKLHGSKFETLDSLCELIVDCEHKTAPIQETGYPSIRTPNIGKGVLILDGVNRVSETTYNEWTRRAIPQADDLILAREAPAGNIGVIPENIKVCLGQRTVLIRPKKNKIISKFLAYLVLSKDVQEQLLSHSTGATVEHINMKDIRAFKIYNLSPITEQQTIAQKLDALSAETKQLEAIYQQKINDLDELKKSILQKAFAGELC